MESLILQPTNHHCGPTAIANSIKLLGGSADFDEIVRLARTSKNGTSWAGLFRALDGLGYNSAEYETNSPRNAWAFLRYWNGRSPIIVWLGSSDHYVVVSGIVGSAVTVIDSDREKAEDEVGVKTFSRSEWLNEWQHKGTFAAIRIWGGPSDLTRTS